MQQEKYQHPTLNFEAGIPVIPLARIHQQPTAQKSSLVFGGGLVLLVGMASGIAIGNHFSERRVAEAQDKLKLEQLQRAVTQKQIEDFCKKSLGGNGGRLFR